MSDRSFYHIVLAVAASVALMFGFATSASGGSTSPVNSTATLDTSRVTYTPPMSCGDPAFDPTLGGICQELDDIDLAYLGMDLAMGYPTDIDTAEIAPVKRFERTYPTCKRPYLTNGTRTCQTTYVVSGKRYAATVVYVDGCHRTISRVNVRMGPNQGEGVRDTCWEGGRYVTYMI